MQSLAPWNPSFSSALSTELETKPFMMFNFSNVGSDGWPATRCCVFRGFLFDDRSTNVLLFTTDKRSAKYKELMKDSRFESCFYFARLKRQFRLRGHARMISDAIHPEIKIAEKEEDAVMSSAEDEDETTMSRDTSISDQNIKAILHTATIGDEDQPIFDIFTRQERKSGNYIQNPSIYEPLEYVVISPSVPNQENLDSSFTSLKDLVHNKKSFQQAKREYLQSHLKPPTSEEWNNERTRCWDTLSRNAKKSFKKPLPGSLLTQEKSKLLDSIDRNVDGTTSSSGFENFVVVCLFVDSVDYLDLGAGGSNNRYVYKRLVGADWKEYEVCP